MKVLDISDPQVAVQYSHDKEFTFHHRILLYRITGARWVTLTPDFEFAVRNFDEDDIVVLERGCEFPEEVRSSCYAFDPVDAVTLATYRRRAKLHAAILGESAELQEPPATVWVYADSLDPHVGDPVSAEALEVPDGFVSLGDRGLVRVDGEEKFVERINSWRLREVQPEAEGRRC